MLLKIFTLACTTVTDKNAKCATVCKDSDLNERLKIDPSPNRGVED